MNVSEIKQIIDKARSSGFQIMARKGRDYYEGKHDIRFYRLFYFDGNGEVKEDKTRSNIKISHPFFTELVDQLVQYMLSGKERYIYSDVPELQEKLDKQFNYNDDFNSELNELLTDVSVKGSGYMYLYRDTDGRLVFNCADSLGIVEVRAKDTQDNCDYVIRWYVERIDKDGEPIKKIEVWDSEKTTYYYEEGSKGIVFDDNIKINPRPHIVSRDLSSGNLYGSSFGFIPFFRLDNCKKQFNGLKPIKELIDDYDLMSCGLSNNLQDASEYLVVVSGFQGDNLEQLIQNVKTKKMIGVDSGGSLEYKTVDVPYEARKTKLELDEKNIYKFGFGFNSSQLGDGNVTNVVIKSRYALLDLKANKLEIRLKQFLRKILKVVLKEINDNNGTDYQLKDVYFKFEREIITNASDNAAIEKTDAEKQQIQINTLLNLANTLDNETIVQNICEVLDIDYEEIKSKLPTDETAATNEATNAVNNIIPEGLS